MIGTHGTSHTICLDINDSRDRGAWLRIMAHCTLIIHIYKPMGMRETCHGLNKVYMDMSFYDEFLLELA